MSALLPSWGTCLLTPCGLAAEWMTLSKGLCLRRNTRKELSFKHKPPFAPLPCGMEDRGSINHSEMSSFFPLQGVLVPILLMLLGCAAYVDSKFPYKPLVRPHLADLTYIFSAYFSGKHLLNDILVLFNSFTSSFFKKK